MNIFRLFEVSGRKFSLQTMAQQQEQKSDNDYYLTETETTKLR